jgi:hypothetical protein
VHRWHQIEESSQMKSEEKSQKTRMVHRRFEPDRLSSTRMADAYEKIVPRSIRVLEIHTKAAKHEWVLKRAMIGS